MAIKMKQKALIEKKEQKVLKASIRKKRGMKKKQIKKKKKRASDID